MCWLKQIKLNDNTTTASVVGVLRKVALVACWRAVVPFFFWNRYRPFAFFFLCVFVSIQVWQRVDSGSGGSWKWERAKGQSLAGKRSAGGWNIHPAPQPPGVLNRFAFGFVQKTGGKKRMKSRLEANNDSAFRFRLMATRDLQQRCAPKCDLGSPRPCLCYAQTEKHWGWHSAPLK